MALVLLSRTIDPGVHFCFYYLSFRNPEIRIVTLMEGLEFHAQFLSGDQLFENFANRAKNLAVSMLAIREE